MTVYSTLNEEVRAASQCQCKVCWSIELYLCWVDEIMWTCGTLTNWALLFVKFLGWVDGCSIVQPPKRFFPRTTRHQTMLLCCASVDSWINKETVNKLSVLRTGMYLPFLSPHTFWRQGQQASHSKNFQVRPDPDSWTPSSEGRDPCMGPWMCVKIVHS